MKCYICAKQGVEKDAVAICIVCEMGLCMGHAVKEVMLVRDIINWDSERRRSSIPIPCLDSSAWKARCPEIKGFRHRKSE